jgi:hypothetical protein
MNSIYRLLIAVVVVNGLLNAAILNLIVDN